MHESMQGLPGLYAVLSTTVTIPVIKSRRIRWRRLEGFIKMDLQEVKRGGMNWIDLPQVMDRKNEMGETSSMNGRGRVV